MRGERILYYGKKVLIFIISVWVLSLVTFYVSRLAPGDPLVSYYGERVEKMSGRKGMGGRETWSE